MVLTLENLETVHPTIDDFKKINFDTLLIDSKAEQNRITQIGYRQKFDELLGDALNSENKIGAKIYLIFSRLTSYFLSTPETPHNPFSPQVTLPNGKSTFKPIDFSKADLEFLKAIQPEISDFIIQSRISDTLWTCDDPRKKENAISAINSYIQYPLTTEKFFSEGSKMAFHRAIYLSVYIIHDIDLSNQIKEILFETFEQTKHDGKAFLLNISDLLFLLYNYLSQDEKNIIKNKLEESAKISENQFISKSYFDGAIQWVEKEKNKSESARLNYEFVFKCEHEIENNLKNNPESITQINTIIEDAINSLNTIPKQYRDDSFDERVKALKLLKGKSDKALFESMHVSIPVPVDVSNDVEYARNIITNKTKEEALFCLSNIVPITNVNDLKIRSKDIIEKYPLLHMFEISHVDMHGHVIKKTEALDALNNNSDTSSSPLYFEMMQEFHFNVLKNVHGLINPGLEIFNLEHPITEKEILDIVNRSSIVTSGRELIWAKALYSGFNNDYIVSTQLLTPLLENFIRELLKQHELITSVSNNGIENEVALGNLLQGDENQSTLVDFFGENLLFELKALLTEKSGFNLRNKVAHGLINQNELMSEGPIYLWWLCLNMIISTSNKNEDGSTPSHSMRVH